MSTSTIGQYFSNRVEELISEFTGHTLIFFKGFGLEQIRFLITHPNSLLDDASLLHEGFLDLEAIDDRWLILQHLSKTQQNRWWAFMRSFWQLDNSFPV